MALTVTQLLTNGPVSIGDRYLSVCTVAFDASYPTGGEPLTKADLGFAPTADPEFFVIATAANGYVLRYDVTNSKMLAYSSAGTETTNTTDLSGLTLTLAVAFGRFPL